jgi:four helix bundle protein
MIREPFTLSDRTVKFSKDVLSFCKNEKPTLVTRPLIDQLIRSATSIGANYAEANNAASKTDFKNKIFIAKKESAETKYWLTLLSDQVDNKQECAELLAESHYILMTFQKIINTLNNGKRPTVSAR